MNLYKLRVKGKKIFVQHEGSISFDMATSTATAKDGTVYHDCTLVEYMCELCERPKMGEIIVDEVTIAPIETELYINNEPLGKHLTTVSRLLSEAINLSYVSGDNTKAQMRDKIIEARRITEEIKRTK